MLNRPDPHPHGGRARTSEGARAAYGATAEAHAAAVERSTAAAGRRGHAQGTGKELQRRQRDDFKIGEMTATHLLNSP